MNLFGYQLLANGKLTIPKITKKDRIFNYKHDIEKYFREISKIGAW